MSISINWSQIRRKIGGLNRICQFYNPVLSTDDVKPLNNNKY